MPVSSLSEALREAWALRKANFPDVLYAAAPGAKFYENAYFRNHPDRFIHISITGTQCRLKCEHCGGKLLEGMIPAQSPQELLEVVRAYRARGATGLLISGGADAAGKVPLDPFLDAIRQVKDLGLTVIVHTGLVDAGTARGLKEAGVDEVLLDVIGDEETARRVYHLKADLQDYLETVRMLVETGLRTVPHIVAGLDFARLHGEWRALEGLSRIKPAALVVVILTPLPGTPMAGLHPPEPQEVGRLLAAARIMNPTLPLALGCARPPGVVKQQYETLALQAGVNAVAYPMETTLALAESLGLVVRFTEDCCSLTLK